MSLNATSKDCVVNAMTPGVMLVVSLSWTLLEGVLFLLFEFSGHTNEQNSPFFNSDVIFGG